MEATSVHGKHAYLGLVNEFGMVIGGVGVRKMEAPWHGGAFILCTVRKRFKN